MNPSTNHPEYSIRYDRAEITYTTQFLISPGSEEVLIDLSSGLIETPNSGTVLPVHSRVALSWSTAERLATILNNVVAKNRQRISAQQSSPHPTPATPHIPQASLPQMNVQRT